MAYAYEEMLPWHEGEQAIHHILNVPEGENPTTPYLNSNGSNMMTLAPLMALGTLDKDNWPWTTVWGGEPGFSRPIGDDLIGIRAQIDRKFDPVSEALFGDKRERAMVAEGKKGEKGSGKMVGGLAIQLQTRRRWKLYGRMVAGTLGNLGGDQEDERGEVQLAVKIEQALPNCPKYLNGKKITLELPEPKLVSDSLPLPQSAIDLIGKVDMFFISSSHHLKDMDTNHRGGPAGFVRVLSNSAENGTVLIYPEYSGNRLYQTLGNLLTTPRAGLVFPDYENADVLYVTGETEILTGKEAHAILPGSNIAIKITVKAARFVQKGLGFRGELGERSPYNPRVRYLPTEKSLGSEDTGITATLIKRETITPTISRYRFRIADPAKGQMGVTWKAGQHVALSFKNELDRGYSHMRNDDPLSLNDDYVRTFTVSSPPPELTTAHLQSSYEGDDMPAKGKFEITVRNVGVVTTFLHSQKLKDRPLVVPLTGFGGEFKVQQLQGERIGFVAGGVGITPLLAQLPELDLSRLHLLWALNVDDLPLAQDLFKRHPELPASTSLFVTGLNSNIRESQKAILEELRKSCFSMCDRRLEESDMSRDVQVTKNIQRFYVCTSPALRRSLLAWMKGREAIYEDFGY